MINCGFKKKVLYFTMFGMKYTTLLWNLNKKLIRFSSGFWKKFKNFQIIVEENGCGSYGEIKWNCFSFVLNQIENVQIVLEIILYLIFKERQCVNKTGFFEAVVVFCSFLFIYVIYNFTVFLVLRPNKLNCTITGQKRQFRVFIFLKFICDYISQCVTLIHVWHLVQTVSSF